MKFDGIFMKIKDLHDKLEVAPSVSYEKFIMHCCDSQKVHMDINIIDQVFEAGSSVSLETFHFIVLATELSCEFNLMFARSLCHSKRTHSHYQPIYLHMVQ